MGCSPGAVLQRAATGTQVVPPRHIGWHWSVVCAVVGTGEELQEMQERQQHKPSVGREPQAAASSRLRKALAGGRRRALLGWK